jgi:hypothetical protein
MIKEKQKRFYSALGAVLTKERLRRNMTVADLVRESGEHHTTIRNIESGGVCSFHHLVWMKEIFNIKVEDIYRNMEGNGDNKKVKRVEDII